MDTWYCGFMNYCVRELGMTWPSTLQNSPQGLPWDTVLTYLHSSTLEKFWAPGLHYLAHKSKSWVSSPQSQSGNSRFCRWIFPSAYLHVTCIFAHAILWQMFRLPCTLPVPTHSYVLMSVHTTLLEQIPFSFCGSFGKEDGGKQRYMPHPCFLYLQD